MNIKENQIIGEIVAQDYRSASVFKKYGIDFCCQGNRTIYEACTSEKINPESVMDDLVYALQMQQEKTNEYTLSLIHISEPTRPY